MCDICWTFGHCFTEKLSVLGQNKLQSEPDFTPTHKSLVLQDQHWTNNSPDVRIEMIRPTSAALHLYLQSVTSE